MICEDCSTVDESSVKKKGGTSLSSVRGEHPLLKTAKGGTSEYHQSEG
jgi:hypothetical protein